VIERLEGGYKNDVVRDGDVVVRLTRAPLESVAWEHRLLGTLPPPAVAPLADPEPRAGGRVASRFPYVEGGPLDRDDPAQREQVAGWLAALHRTRWEGGQRPGAAAWPERDLVRNAWWDWEIVEKPTSLARAYERVVAFLADPPPLRVGIVHGDVYRGNMRVDDGRLVGVIDWEEARLDWLASELANAAWEMRDVDGFVGAYVDAGGPAETEHLETLVLLRNVADVLYSLTSKARGEPYDQSHVDVLLGALA